MDVAAPPEEIKLYFDYKSPFAFLASGPAFALDDRFRVRVRWLGPGVGVVPRGRGRTRVRALHRRRGGGPRVRRAALPLPRRAVLGARPPAAPRGASPRHRPGTLTGDAARTRRHRMHGER